ncbi:conserved hypothetical protein [Mesotoga infera]|nr:conserved hypothetical protein [Mesotoga infera]
MRITILNGARKGSEKFDMYVDKIASSLRDRGNDVEYFLLRDLDIKQCMGCFEL